MSALDPAVYTQVASDTGATFEGFMVCAVAFALRGSTLFEPIGMGIVTGVAVGPVALAVWSAVSYVLSRAAGGVSTYLEILRPIGYSAAPLAIGVIPVAGAAFIGATYSGIIQVQIHHHVGGLSRPRGALIVLVGFAVPIGFTLLAMT